MSELHPAIREAIVNWPGETGSGDIYDIAEYLESVPSDDPGFDDARRLMSHWAPIAYAMAGLIYLQAEIGDKHGIDAGKAQIDNARERHLARAGSIALSTDPAEAIVA